MSSTIAQTQEGQKRLRGQEKKENQRLAQNVEKQGMPSSADSHHLHLQAPVRRSTQGRRQGLSTGQDGPSVV